MAIITGTGGNDTLNGTSSSDQIYGLGGDDTLNGGGGNDTLDGGTGADTMSGGTGSDIYYVDDSGDAVIELSAQGNDEVRATVLNYTLTDNVEKLKFVGSGNFTGTGNDLSNDITGGSGDDTLSGGDGHDQLFGGAGDDSLFGGVGYDVLTGGLGADYMEGGADNDIYVVDNDGDTVVELSGGGDGDQVYVTLASYTLPDEVETLTYNGGSANFTGVGNALANTIYGGSGDDFLFGEGGNDTLRGNTGADLLFGGDGDDYLVGGNGADYYDGGDGADTISIGTFQSGTGSDADTISGFEQGIDIIDLSSTDANLLVSGNQAFSFIGNAAFSGGSAELRWDVSGSDTIVEGDINGDAVADFQIVILGSVTLAASDFIL